MNLLHDFSRSPPRYSAEHWFGNTVLFAEGKFDVILTVHRR